MTASSDGWSSHIFSKRKGGRGRIYLEKQGESKTIGLWSEHTEGLFARSKHEVPFSWNKKSIEFTG